MGKVIPVRYENKLCYEIHLERDFNRFPELLQRLGYTRERKVCIITDSHVAPLYLKAVLQVLEEYFDICTSYVFTAGEASKNTDTVGGAYEHLIQNGFDRKDLIVALGGGVAGDLAGFTAATYLRGIDFVQVPTTLLSQVDSSIGGKTGVDFMQYKNMVGAFYMPKLVYMNLSVLASLPARQYFSGMGEILKHGQIKNADYYRQVSAEYARIINRDLDIVEEMVYGSCKIKRDVVERDPKEMGERALLNFGHTIGHAIEKLSGFSLFHGECVALGMVAATFLSCRYGADLYGDDSHGSYTIEQLAELEQTLTNFHLPIRLQCEVVCNFSAEEVLAATKLDKKMESGRIKFILLEEPGKAYITRDLTEEQILEGIRYLYA